MKSASLLLSLALCMTLTCCGSNGERCTDTLECEPGLECMVMPEPGSSECGDQKRCVQPCKEDADCCEDCKCFDPCGGGGSCGKLGSPG